MLPECDGRYGKNNDLCKKWGNENEKCNPSNIEWFDEKLEKCEINKVCRNSSIFGNFYFYLTDEDIEDLKSGKVLYSLDEYGMFIAYKG